MSSKEVIETIYGKHHKYEIMKDSGGLLTSIKQTFTETGSYYKGSYSSLSAAVAKVKQEG